MNQQSKVNIKKLIFIILKITIFFASISFIYTRIKDSGESFSNVLKSASKIYLIPITILMLLNWFLEAQKWKISASIIEDISIKKAFKGTFSGVTISTILPNRMGDFLGKILFLKTENKKEGMPLALYGNYAQLVTTLLFGSLGIITLVIYPGLLPQLKYNMLFSLITLLIAVVSIYIYLNPNLWVKWISNLKQASKFQIENIKKLNLLKILLLSIGRYLIFLIQFWLALKMFNVDLSITHIISLIGMYYLFVTFIPGLFLAKIGIRESVALWLFTGIFNDLTIISVTLLVWLINIAIPSLIGAIIISNIGWNSIKKQ